MRLLISIAFVFLFSFFGRTQEGKNDKVKQEIRELLVALNVARMSHDRTALEKIYADEFIVIHAAGVIDDKTTTINEVMDTDSIRALAMPNLDNIYVYGDVVLLRLPPSNTMSNTTATSRTIGTYLYTRKNGKWQISQAQGTVLLPERKIIKLDAAVLDTYAGKYERGAGQITQITRNGDILLLNVINRGFPKRRLSPVSDTKFYDNIGSEYTFTKDDKGAIIIFIVKFANGQQVEWKKVE